MDLLQTTTDDSYTVFCTNTVEVAVLTTELSAREKRMVEFFNHLPTHKSNVSQEMVELLIGLYTNDTKYNIITTLVVLHGQMYIYYSVHTKDIITVGNTTITGIPQRLLEEGFMYPKNINQVEKFLDLIYTR